MLSAEHVKYFLCFLVAVGYRLRRMERSKNQQKKEKNSHAVALGKMGAKARLQKLSPENRRQIARHAAQARWAKEKNKKEGV
jgi:hypothetical protein